MTWTADRPVFRPEWRQGGKRPAGGASAAAGAPETTTAVSIAANTCCKS